MKLRLAITWCFRNDFNMLIWSTRKISYFLLVIMWYMFSKGSRKNITLLVSLLLLKCIAPNVGLPSHHRGGPHTTPHFNINIFAYVTPTSSPLLSLLVFSLYMYVYINIYRHDSPPSWHRFLEMLYIVATYMCVM